MMRGLTLKTKIEADKNNANAVAVQIRPLQSGYGQTLANSIRRVLLSSMEGIAIVGFKIDGVSNEFTTIPGVLEDVIDITLALKKLRFTGSLEEDQLTLKILKNGKGEVKASDIQTSGEVEVADPELKICTLTDASAKLNAEIIVRVGSGYKQAKEQEDLPADVIALDSSFSPVLRVRYSVSETRDGQITNLDEVNMIVETDGSMRPEEAFEKACGTLMQQYEILAGSFAESYKLAAQKEVVVTEEEISSDSIEMLESSIEGVGLKARTVKSLQDAGVQTVADLLQYSDSDLLSLSGFGRGALDEVKEALAKMGF